MRIHTNLEEVALEAAAKAAGVTLFSVKRHGSTVRDHAFSVGITGTGRIGGQYGNAFGGKVRGATWDEWGTFLAELFEVDPDMRAGGSANRPTYNGADAFHAATLYRFENGMPDDAENRHAWEYVGPGWSDALGGATTTHQCKRCTAMTETPVPVRKVKP